MRALATIAFAVLIGCLPWPLQAGPGGTPDVTVRAVPVTVTPDRAEAIRPRGTVVLTAEHPDFGGFSGLLMAPGPRMIAASDRGSFLLADLDSTAEGLIPRSAGLSAMRSPDGTTLDASDAEALTLRNGTIIVAFERDHRIMMHDREGVLTDPIRNERFDNLAHNRGLEALATLPDGQLLAIVEAPLASGAPLFIVRWSGRIDEHILPLPSRHVPTGADIGPDGRLYVVFRHYTPLTGVSIRVRRYDLGDDGVPMAETARTLLAFEHDSGIDNIEAIGLWRDRSGRQRMALLSDDNFSAVQRTLLMDFELLPDPAPR